MPYNRYTSYRSEYSPHHQRRTWTWWFSKDISFSTVLSNNASESKVMIHRKAMLRWWRPQWQHLHRCRSSWCLVENFGGSNNSQKHSDQSQMELGHFGHDITGLVFYGPRGGFPQMPGSLPYSTFFRSVFWAVRGSCVEAQCAGRNSELVSIWINVLVVFESVLWIVVFLVCLQSFQYLIISWNFTPMPTIAWLEKQCNIFVCTISNYWVVPIIYYIVISII